VSYSISEQLVRQSVVPMACTIAAARSVPEAGVIRRARLGRNASTSP
jgi:hypothetical protein